MDVPVNWETVNNEKVFRRVQLSANDQEYKDVAKAFLSTAKTTVKLRLNTSRTRCSINSTQAVVDTADAGVQNEMTLWHGTSTDTLESINQTGLNQRYYGKNEMELEILHLKAQLSTVKHQREQLEAELKTLRPKAVVLDPPAHWLPIPVGAQFNKIKVMESEPIFQEIASNLQTFPRKLFSIKKVERLENILLFQRYSLQKVQMLANGSQVVPIERRFWHGTSSDSLENIICYGFNRSFAGKNGAKIMTTDQSTDVEPTTAGAKIMTTDQSTDVAPTTAERLETELLMVKKQHDGLALELQTLISRTERLETELLMVKEQHDGLALELQTLRSRTDGLALELQNLRSRTAKIPLELVELRPKAALLEPPCYWTAPQPAIGCNKVKLMEYEAPFLEIKKKLECFQRGHIWLKSVERVENLILYQQYRLRRLQMTENMSAAAVERWLWHGSDSASIENIVIRIQQELL